MSKLYDELLYLQEKYEKIIPASVRDDADNIEQYLAYIKDYPSSAEERIACEVVLWTVKMFEAYEEGELDNTGDEQ